MSCISLAETRYGLCGRVCKYLVIKAFTNARSWFFGTSQLSNNIKNEAMVDALWICYIVVYSYYTTNYTYQREVSALLVLYYWAAKASKSGTSNKYRLSRFFFVSIIKVYKGAIGYIVIKNENF